MAVGRRLRQHAGVGPAIPTWIRSPSISLGPARSPPRSTGTGPTCTRAPGSSRRWSFPQVQAPTMGVWSTGDFALAEAGMTGSQQYVDGTVAVRAHRGCRATGCSSKHRIRCRRCCSTSCRSRSRVDYRVGADSRVRRATFVIGHAPSMSLAITVCVRLIDGWCQLRNDTPASQPSNRTASPEPASQNPSPYRSSIGDDTAGSNHLGDPFGGNDATVEERQPEPADVGHRRVDPAVAVASNREVKDVAAPHSVDLEVAHRGPTGQLVATQERGVDHAGRLADALVHEFVEPDAAGPFGDQREDDETTVAVRELLACGELGREDHRARRGTARWSPARAPEPASGSRHGRARCPRRDSRRCPTGVPAGARRSRHRRSAAGRCRGPRERVSTARACHRRSD